MVRKFTTPIELPGDPASGLQASSKDYVDNAVSGRVPTTRSVIAGTGLSGGGALSADRILAVAYGTSAGTAAQGNDSRITGAEQTSNKGASNGYAPLVSGIVPHDYYQYATGSTDGSIILAGDLGGTATSPTVPGLASKAPLASPTFTGTVTTAKSVSTPVALTDGATISTDASLGNHFRVTIAGNRTLANPSNLTDGQMLLFEIKQDATGGRTLAYGNKFNFGSDIPSAVVSTVANKTDYLGVKYNSSRDKLDVISFAKGY